MRTEASSEFYSISGSNARNFPYVDNWYGRWEFSLERENREFQRPWGNGPTQVRHPNVFTLTEFVDIGSSGAWPSQGNVVSGGRGMGASDP